MPVFDPSQWEMDDAREPYVLPDGTEAKLRILEVTVDTDKNSNSYFLIRFEAVDETYSKDFMHFLRPPHKDMDAKQRNRTLFEMKCFFEAFQIDATVPTDPAQDWPGLVGFAILGVRNDERFGEQNHIRKFVTGN